MWIILLTVISVFRRHFSDKSEEFQKGFQTAIDIFEIAMNKHPQFNAYVECKRKDAEIKEIQKELRKKEFQIKNLGIKINEKALKAESPLSHYREYIISPPDFEEFTIVANLTMETFNQMCFNFGYRYKYESSAECKQKILQFINSKSSLGYQAFKDIKTAMKEVKGIKIKKAVY